MAAPVLAGIPMVYQMLVGAGILAGGAVTANKMQKEIQNTIDTNPGVIDEALKNIFMGPARDLINPKMLEEIQNVKPTTTAKKKTMPTTEISPDDVMANTLFQEPTNNLFGMIDTPSGTVLAPDATDIETQRKEAAPKPLVTPMPTGQQDQTLSTPVPQQQDQTLTTPVPEKTDMLPGMDQAPMPDMNILNKEDTSYRIQHQPRGPETEDSVRLDDLTKSITGEKAGYPDDFYSDRGQRLYAPGPRFKDDEYGMANQESFQIINKVKNKPDEEVTIYRAVPNDDKIKDINEGDFVTLSKKYAELHGAGGYGRDGKDAGKILEKKVKVKDIYWDQNDVNEFGYFPTNEEKQTKKIPELNIADIEKGIKIVKSPDTPDTYDVMYDNKIIKQLYKKRTKFEGENEYVVIEPSDGSYDDTFIGLKNSKDRVKQNVAKQILDDSKKTKTTAKPVKQSLTEVSTSPTEPFDVTDTSTVDFFPFNPVDFKKNGILNNPEIIKAFDDLKNDVKIKPPVGFDEDYMALQQSDSFYLTPPRAQMEIALRYLEKQLEENKASEETLNLIKNLNKDLQSKIKDTGYYAENKKVEDRITNLPGMTNKLKKLKSSN
jgi:hypothetical protein